MLTMRKLRWFALGFDPVSVLPDDAQPGRGRGEDSPLVYPLQSSPTGGKGIFSLTQFRVDSLLQSCTVGVTHWLQMQKYEESDGLDIKHQ